MTNSFLLRAISIPFYDRHGVMYHLAHQKRIATKFKKPNIDLPKYIQEYRTSLKPIFFCGVDNPWPICRTTTSDFTAIPSPIRGIFWTRTSLQHLHIHNSRSQLITTFLYASSLVDSFNGFATPLIGVIWSILPTTPLSSG